MEIIAIQKNVNSTPRKLRLVADMVRKMAPARALQTLEFTNKAAAIDLAKAIKTAVANAKMRNLPEKTLLFKAMEINEGIKYRRARAGSRGRSKPFKRRMSHIRIILTDETGRVKSPAKDGARQI